MSETTRKAYQLHIGSLNSLFRLTTVERTVKDNNNVRYHTSLDGRVVAFTFNDREWYIGE